jgi:hypothetical protein
VDARQELLPPLTLTLEPCSIFQLEARLMMSMEAHQDHMEPLSQLLLIINITLFQLVTLIVDARQELLPLLTSTLELSSISQPVVKLMMLMEAHQDHTEPLIQLLFILNIALSQLATLMEDARLVQLQTNSMFQTPKQFSISQLEVSLMMLTVDHLDLTEPHSQ